MSEISYQGYHGTFVERVGDIMQNGFCSQIRKDHWLGQGFYFYDKEYLARWWIETKRNNNPTYHSKRVAVVHATIVANRQEVLDLDDPKDTDRFLDYYCRMVGQLDIKFQGNDPHQNRCFFIDLMSQEENLKVVKYTFDKINPSYGKHNIAAFTNNQINLGINYRECQICVKHNENIVEKNIIYQETGDIVLTMKSRREKHGRYKI